MPILVFLLLLLSDSVSDGADGAPVAGQWRAWMWCDGIDIHLSINHFIYFCRFALVETIQ